MNNSVITGAGHVMILYCKEQNKKQNIVQADSVQTDPVLSVRPPIVSSCFLSPSRTVILEPHAFLLDRCFNIVGRAFAKYGDIYMYAYS